VTILDLAFLEYPNLFLKGERGYLQLKNWTDYSVAQADHLITISESTKRDILKHYHYPSTRITVAYPGINSLRFRKESPEAVNMVLKKLRITPPYILYVGTLQPRKNLSRLVEAFAQLPRKYRHFQLVIAGGQGWLMDEFDAKVKQSGAKDRIRLTGYVEESDLPALYSGAICLTLIGLHEGFGIPAAEALACGTLPVVSGTSSLPEVVGQGGVLVDPFSLTSIKHGIITAIDMPEAKRQAHLILGQTHIKQFTWEQAAQTVLKVLYDVSISRPER
jgi:glycosyltransferase involved in cell wall biosynthesis